MPVFHGVRVNWGVLTNISSVVGSLMQSRDHTFASNSELILDGGETPVSKVYWADYEEATFVYVATDGGYASGNRFGGTNYSLNNQGAGDIAHYFLPAVGDIVTLSDVYNTQLNGEWFVDAISTHTSNTTATRVTLKLSRYPNIEPISSF